MSQRSHFNHASGNIFYEAIRVKDLISSFASGNIGLGGSSMEGLVCFLADGRVVWERPKSAVVWDPRTKSWGPPTGVKLGDLMDSQVATEEEIRDMIASGIVFE